MEAHLNLEKIAQMGGSLKMRLATLHTEALTRAGRAVRIETLGRLCFVVASGVIAAAFGWYFYGPARFVTQATGFILTLAAIVFIFLIIYIYWFCRTAYRTDRAMVPLILIGVGVLGVICLLAGMLWLVWDQHHKIDELTNIVASEKTQRVEITKTAAQLIKLWQGKAEFESAVSETDKAWASVESIPRIWASFQQLAPQDQGTALAKSLRPIGGWQAALRNIEGIVRRTIGDPINEHTDHYDPTAQVPGEENFPAELNVAGNPYLKELRKAFAGRANSTRYIAAARSKFSSKIAELEQKLTDTAREDAK